MKCKEELEARLKEFKLYLKNEKKALKSDKLYDINDIQEKADAIKYFLIKIEELEWMLNKRSY